MGGVARIGLRRSTQSNWLTVDPVLADGELGYETDTGDLKIGDGSTKYSNLNYLFRTESGIDLADDGTIEDTLNELATTSDSNSIFTNPSSGKLLVDMSKNWPSADSASIANSLSTDALDAIGEVDASILSGTDGSLVTGTAGTSGNVVTWNADGDAVDSGSALSDILKSSDLAANGGSVPETDRQNNFAKDQSFGSQGNPNGVPVAVTDQIELLSNTSARLSFQTDLDDTPATAWIDVDIAGGVFFYSDRDFTFYVGADLILDIGGRGVTVGDFTDGFVCEGISTFKKQAEFQSSVTSIALSSDPADPPAGQEVRWLSDGTGSGNDGDWMQKITDTSGTTKIITLVDFSAN